MIDSEDDIHRWYYEGMMEVEESSRNWTLAEHVKVAVIGAVLGLTIVSLVVWTFLVLL